MHSLGFGLAHSFNRPYLRYDAMCVVYFSKGSSFIPEICLGLVVDFFSWSIQ